MDITRLYIERNNKLDIGSGPTYQYRVKLTKEFCDEWDEKELFLTIQQKSYGTFVSQQYWINEDAIQAKTIDDIREFQHFLIINELDHKLQHQGTMPYKETQEAIIGILTDANFDIYKKFLRWGYSH
jgi:hypothetical protein